MNWNNILKDFLTISKAKWLDQAEKELKGKTLDQLNWNFDANVYSPFFHPDDDPISGIVGQKSSNKWEIGQVVWVSNPKMANNDTLDSLMKGANSLLFIMERELDFAELELLLAGVNLEWISSHFQLESGKLSGQFLKHFFQLIENKEHALSKIKCSFDLDETAMTEGLKLNQEVNYISLSRISALNLNSSSAEYIADLLHQANKQLDLFSKSNSPIDRWNHNIVFQLDTTDHYFGNIARIRALKLLWNQILSEWGLNGEKEPLVEIQISRNYLRSDANTNKIIATAQALSAVVAGVDRIFIFPSDAKEKTSGSTQSNRIAVNIQHILENESYLADVYDASAGSYFIEQITNDLAQKAWEEFQKMET